jgi:hypothetical protein
LIGNNMSTAYRRIRHALFRIGIALASFTIGWTGAGVLVVLLVNEIPGWFGIRVPQGVSAVVSVTAGAAAGALPFGILGMNWAARRWPPP